MDRDWLDAKCMRLDASEMYEQARRHLKECERVRLEIVEQRDRLLGLNGSGDASSEGMLDAFLRGAVARTGADLANIQLRDPATSALHIAAHSGFPRSFLDFFDSVTDGHAACGVAMSRAERIVVADVADSRIFAGPSLEVMLDARVRSVQSTPLLREGRIIGMMSTHYHGPHTFTANELKVLDALARTAERLLTPVTPVTPVPGNGG